MVSPDVERFYGVVARGSRDGPHDVGLPAVFMPRRGEAPGVSMAQRA